MRSDHVFYGVHSLYSDVWKSHCLTGAPSLRMRFSACFLPLCSGWERIWQKRQYNWKKPSREDLWFLFFMQTWWYWQYWQPWQYCEIVWWSAGGSLSHNNSCLKQLILLVTPALWDVINYPVFILWISITISNDEWLLLFWFKPVSTGVIAMLSFLLTNA